MLEKVVSFVGRVGRVDQVGADPVHGKHKTVHDGVHQRHHEGHGTVGEQLGVGEFLVGLGENLASLVILGIVGAHHAQAGEFSRATRLMLSVSTAWT